MNVMLVMLAALAWTAELAAAHGLIHLDRLKRLRGKADDHLRHRIACNEVRIYHVKLLLIECRRIIEYRNKRIVENRRIIENKRIIQCRKIIECRRRTG